MADEDSFKRGAKTYPLSTSTGNDALFDADPFLFYALEFFTSVIETHVGGRLMEAASRVPSIAQPIAMSVPLDPVPTLQSTHYKFPLLAVYRKGGTLEHRAVTFRKDLSTFEVIYVLPPLDAAGAEQVVPLLIAIRDVLDDRTFVGFDPAYTPTGGVAGECPWVEYAGVEKVTFTDYALEHLGLSDDLVFYAIRMKGTLSERPEVDLGSFEEMAGANVDVDIKDPVEETTVSDFIEFKTYPAPTLTSVSPSSGTKAGGTTLTLTGTGFLVGTLPRITVGGLAATSVNVVSATSATCVTPEHGAFDTFEADIEYEAIDGQSDTLPEVYTFTTP